MKLRTISILLFVSVYWLPTATLAVSSGFSYQGRLDKAGQPYSGTVDMIFALYDAESDGAQVGPKLEESVKIEGGLFQIRLDFGAQPFESGLWLQIVADEHVLSPRQPVTPAPLTMIAADAVNARGALFPDSNGGFALAGTPNAGAIPAQGPGTRLMWYPGKAAFRAGTVTGAQWDDARIGLYSFAIGHNAIASGAASMAMGSGSITGQSQPLIASGEYSTALLYGTASGLNSSLFMGGAAQGPYSTAIHGGNAEGAYSTALGWGSRAEGWSSFAVGGESGVTHAAGDCTGAIGNGVKAEAKHMVAIGRYNSAAGFYNDEAPDRPLFVAGNGISNEDRRVAMRLLHNGNLLIDGALSVGSDRNSKHSIAAVDPADILHLVDQLRISNWHYNHSPGILHIGPMAQDFYAAFAVGEDDTGIAPGDANGVALAATQALHRIANSQNKRIAELEAITAAQKQQLAAGQQTFSLRLEAVESHLTGGGESALRLQASNQRESGATRSRSGGQYESL